MQEKLVPELRFKEFDDLYIEKIFGKEFDFHTTNSYSRDQLNYELGEVYNVHYGDIHTKFPSAFNLKNELVPFINSDVNLDKIKKASYLDIGDLVMADASEDYADIGKTIEIIDTGERQVLAGLHTFHIRPKHKTAIGYYGYIMQSWSFRYQLMRYAQGTKVLGLSSKRVAKIKYNLPSLPEQQKIADFLTSVDRKIQALTRKVELLKDYKKGVMQKVFNCQWLMVNGQLTFVPPEIRFHDDNGEEFSDWEELMFSSFLDHRKREIPKPQKQYLALGLRSHGKGVFQKPNSDPAKNAMTTLFVANENDLIVNITFAWEGAIAIVREEDDGGLVSHRFPTYILDENRVLVDYMRYIIVQRRFIKMLDLLSPGGAGRNRVLSKKEFVKIKWSFPCIKEQTKIANFLTSIDEKIGVEKKKLEKMKEWKKGLLQTMFV